MRVRSGSLPSAQLTLVHVHSWCMLERMKTALVTGASSGIGLATARLLAMSGWRVLAVARRADRLEALARETGDDCHPVVLDLTAPDAPAIIAQAVDRHAGGRLDGLVNNAGIFAVADAAHQDHAHLDALWTINVRSVVLTTRVCLPALALAHGTIVNVSSVVVDNTFPGCGIYTATKAAIDAWSRILREELRPKGVRVGIIAPGGTTTEAFPGDLDVDPARLCRPEDIAVGIRAMLELAPHASIDRMVIAPAAGPA